MSLLIFCLYFFEGGSLSYLLSNDRDLSLACSVAVSIFLSNIFWLVLNFLHIPFSSVAIFLFHFVLCLFLLFYMRGKFVDLFSYYVPDSRKKRMMVFFLLLFFVGFLFRTESQILWSGDGMGIWASRANEWANFGSLKFSSQTLERLKTWLNYPIFHSLSIMTSLFVFPRPSILTANNFDTFYIVGIFLSLHYVLKKIIFRHDIVWGLSLFITFCLRDLIGMVGSGYADLFLSYCFILVFSIFFNLALGEKKQSLKIKILQTIIFSCLMMSKSEGTYRFAILLFCFLCFYLKSWKILVVPVSFSLLIHFIFKWSNPNVLNYSHYVSDIYLNVDFIQSRIGVVVEAFKLSFFDWPYKIFKSFKIHLLVAFALSSFILLFERKRAESYKLQWFILSSIVLNLTFNYLPFLVTKLDGAIFNDPRLIADAITSRLNLQISYMILVWSIWQMRDRLNLGKKKYL